MVSIDTAARQTGLADTDVVALTISGRVHYEGFRGRVFVDLADLREAMCYLDVRPTSGANVNCGG